MSVSNEKPYGFLVCYLDTGSYSYFYSISVADLFSLVCLMVGIAYVPMSSISMWHRLWRIFAEHVQDLFRWGSNPHCRIWAFSVSVRIEFLMALYNVVTCRISAC